MNEEDFDEILKELEEQKKKLSKLSETANSIIKAIEEQGEFLKKIVEKRGEESILLESVKDIGVEKKNRCYYYRDGLCRYWEWSKDPEGILFVIKSRKFKNKSGEEVWLMDPHPFYCALCWKYEEE